MSTQFKPIEIPPGVVAKPTKQMRSTAWAEVNLMRWVESRLTPIGGQAQYSYTFASRCKRIHGWFGLDQVYRIAYLCEAHLYVDVGGDLIDISPTPAIIPPALAGAGGYGDGLYGFGLQIQTTAFAAGATAITMQAANPGWIQPTMDVYNMTTSQHVGTVATYTGTALTSECGGRQSRVGGRSVDVRLVWQVAACQHHRGARQGPECLQPR